jgi:hypothetical protein
MTGDPFVFACPGAPGSLIIHAPGWLIGNGDTWEKPACGQRIKHPVALSVVDGRHPCPRCRRAISSHIDFLAAFHQVFE